MYLLKFGVILCYYLDVEFISISFLNPNFLIIFLFLESRYGEIYSVIIEEGAELSIHC